MHINNNQRDILRDNNNIDNDNSNR